MTRDEILKKSFKHVNISGTISSMCQQFDQVQDQKASFMRSGSIGGRVDNGENEDEMRAGGMAVLESKGSYY